MPKCPRWRHHDRKKPKGYYVVSVVRQFINFPETLDEYFVCTCGYRFRQDEESLKRAILKGTGDD